MRNKLIAGVAAGAIAALGVALPANAISDTTADLYVLHAVPDLTVDVYVNGELTLDDFEPGTLTDPLDLPAGDYEVAITAADATDASSPAIGPVTLTLEANTSYTAVAHLGADGTPTATMFTNDLSAIPAGEGKLTVRHTAAAPAVDVLANDAVAFENLSNPDEVKANLPVGTISAAVAATGTTDPVIGPADVTIAEGVNTIVYAWGSLDDENLALAVQTIDGLHSNPGGVDSGTAGLAADSNNGALIGGLGALAALLALAGFAATRLTAARASK
ncbi:lipoprotein [Leifsonia rubra CMS 76R]|nr:lipoprotein [Leifsonia rubra CMS 76R]